MKTTSSLLLLTSAAALATATAYGQAVVDTVGVYDEQTDNTATVTAEAFSNNITLAQFQLDVASAFTSDTGGVWDFDTSWGPATNSFTINYGTSGTSSLSLLSSNNLGQNSTGNSGTVGISGDNHLGIANNSGATWTFGSGLTHFGLTGISRTGVRDVTLTFTLADASTVIFDEETIPDVSVEEGAVFFGYQASELNPITMVEISTSNFTRFEDFGFIAVPEPTTYAFLFGCLSLFVVAIRRRLARRQ
ncbi:MAG: PEP-CTERM sorting domain-containing protein [Opitutales bacterium]